MCISIFLLYKVQHFTTYWRLIERVKVDLTKVSLNLMEQIFTYTSLLFCLDFKYFFVDFEGQILSDVFLYILEHCP